MVFGAADLGAWLVGLLADAGRRKLTELVFGTEQERALHAAASAAVRRTADELSTSVDVAPDQIAMVIGKVFRQPVPGELLTGRQTLLEVLQAGVAGQLTVLDDAGLTGTGQSSAEVLGVPGGAVAKSLTGHLVREIIVGGMRGGPLTPLADQFNFDLLHLQGQRHYDLTFLQGQRLEGAFTELAAEIRSAWPRPDNAAGPAGRPLDEVTDPFALEVHRPVQLDRMTGELAVLPEYVPREHDAALAAVVGAAAAGSSRIAVLVGGSSTGKTRACWQALDLLRGQTPEWRLWHPIDPSRPEAALAELPVLGPRTVVWLNEAQFYLATPDATGERVAAGLRELLRDPARGPILVLATIWPAFWLI